jgi:putative restriction endonuclease
MNAWRDECVFLLEHLGGHAYLKDIYDKFIEIHTRPITKGYQASIRDALEKGSLESVKFDGTALFYMVEGKSKGHYGLIKQDKNIFDLTTDDDEFCDGKQLLRTHLIRERNQFLITKAKLKFKKEHNGELFCEACGFKFADKYGDLGTDFIEVHNIKPILKEDENEKVSVEDFVMLCSNCHSMIHRKRPWTTKENLKDLFK